MPAEQPLDQINRQATLSGLKARSLTLVDALEPEFFAMQHLPGAVNLCAEDVDRYAAERLPADNDAPLVVYCCSPTCEKSEAVGLRLRDELGYANVRRYVEGSKDWIAAGLPYATDLSPQDALPQDARDEILRLTRSCAPGDGSGLSWSAGGLAAHLRLQGIGCSEEQVAAAWEALGVAPAAPGDGVEVVPVRDVDQERLAGLHAAGAVVVDVREADDHRRGRIGGAIGIPIGQLATRTSELPQDRPVYAICYAGNRSVKATELMREAGMQAYNVLGGMSLWERTGRPVERDGHAAA